jgi:probable HAF family extracellular repeat protein
MWHGKRRTTGSLALVLGLATTLLVTAGLVGAKGKPPKPPPEPEPPGPAYTLIHLGTLGGTFSKAYAINEAGQVVGNSNAADGKTYPFLITPEDTDDDGEPDCWFRDDDPADGVNDLMIPLELLGGNDTPAVGYRGIAVDINERGQVVGRSTFDSATNTAPTHAVLWEGSSITDLGVFETGKGSMAEAINNDGLIVGRSASIGTNSTFLIVPEDTNGDGALEWFADQNGDGRNDLMTLLEPEFPVEDINDAGQVLGNKGYPINRGLLLTPLTNDDGTPDLWWLDEDGDGLNDLLVELPPLESGNTTVAEGLNSSGQVAGTSAAKEGKWTLWHAVRWSSDSEPLPTDLGAPGNKWGSSSGTAINDQGDVVGGGEGEAMLWIDGNMYALFDLLTNPDGVGTVDKAHDINNAGQIVGSTTNGDDIEAFIAVPADG